MSRLPSSVMARLLVLAYVRVNGGQGSGNFGHQGRPGEVGGSGTTPAQGSDAERILDGNADYAENLNKDDRRAVKFYMSNEGYSELNNPLKKNPDRLHGTAARLQRVIENAPLHDTVLTYRGVRGNTASRLDKLNVGDVIRMNGFQSTSVDESRALAFSAIYGRRMLLEIETKRGLWLDPIDEREEFEQELLLPHKSTFTVISRREGQDVLRLRVRHD